MKESEVWQEATKIWEKRGKVKGFDGICIMETDSGNWIIDIKTSYFSLTTQVRRFLDGLE